MTGDNSDKDNGPLGCGSLFFYNIISDNLCNDISAAQLHIAQTTELQIKFQGINFQGLVNIHKNREIYSP